MYLPKITLNKFVIRQCILAIALTIDCILLGAGYTFSATLLPQLENDPSIKITKSEETWIASLSSLTCIPGSLAGCFLAQIFGRKWSYVIISLSNIIAWSILSSSIYVWHFYVGRALQGFNAGLGYSIVICFIVEVFDFKYRAIFLNLINIGSSFGMLLVDIFGSYYPYQTSAYILTALSLLYFCLFLCLKNTYVWYLQRRDEQQARKHFYWYKKDTPSNEENFRHEQTLADIDITFNELTKEWRRREFYIPMLIILLYNTTIMCTGGFGIMLYSVEIMKGVVFMDEYLTTIIIDIIRVLSTFGTALLLTFTPVRFITNISTISCTLSLLVTSLALYLKSSWEGSSIIALIAILSFNFFFNLGYVNFGIICIGELLTGIGKSSGTAIVGIYFFLLYFAFGHLVPFMFDNLGHIVCFLIFGICTLIGGTGLYFILPETHGLNNKQIRDNFKNKS